MGEEVLAAVIGRDEPEALLVVEPLHGSCSHGVPSGMCCATRRGAERRGCERRRHCCVQLTLDPDVRLYRGWSRRPAMRCRCLPARGGEHSWPVFLICDDAIGFPALVRHWLADAAGVNVVGVARSDGEAMALMSELDPDVVILDHLESVGGWRRRAW